MLPGRSAVDCGPDKGGDYAFEHHRYLCVVEGDGSRFLGERQAFRNGIDGEDALGPE